MFDGIMNNAKGSLNMMIMFFVAALVGGSIGTLLAGNAYDIVEILKWGVSAALAGFTTGLVMGSVK